MKKNDIPHVYLDMDGVQCDFDGAVHTVLGMSFDEAKHKTQEEIDKLANTSPQIIHEFFANLEQLSGGKKITDWLNTNNIPYTILSAPLRGPYSSASVTGKKVWLQRYTPSVVDTAIFKHDKHEHAMDGGRPNVLIDDYHKKIDAWNNAGGIAIKHEDQRKVPDAAERTIRRLEEIFNIGK